MDWEQLAYFRVLARHEHMGRASEELGISQSALSRSLARLENRYGLRLFDRAKRGLRLNIFGSTLLTHVDNALRELENAESHLGELAGNIDRQVALGFFGTLGTKVVPELIVSFQRRFPKTRFRLFQGGFPMLRERLARGDIDLCLSSPRHAAPELEWTPLWQEELVALVPRDHPRALEEQLDLQDLAGETMVALREGNGLRYDLDRLAREAGFRPQIAFEGIEVAPLVGLVGAGFGIALIPKNLAESQSVAVAIRIRSPRCYRTIGLSWHRQRHAGASVRAFREHVIAQRPEALEPGAK